MKFRSVIENDVTLLKSWIDSDPYHKGDSVEWWTSPGLFNGVIEDTDGPVCFVKLVNLEEVGIVLHTQFAPMNEVSRRRLVLVMKEAIPSVLKISEPYGRISFQSVNPSLISFMKRFGFEKDVNDSDIYVLKFDRSEAA